MVTQLISIHPVDAEATNTTVNLYRNLKRISGEILQDSIFKPRFRDNIIVTVVFSGFTLIFSFITSLSNDLVMNSGFFYLHFAGILLNIHGVHVLIARKAMKRYVFLIMLDILGSFLLSWTFGLTGISILYVVFCALILILSSQFAVGEFNAKSQRVAVQL